MMQPPQQPGWQGQPRPLGPPGPNGPRPSGPPGQVNGLAPQMNNGVSNGRISPNVAPPQLSQPPSSFPQPSATTQPARPGMPPAPMGGMPPSSMGGMPPSSMGGMPPSSMSGMSPGPMGMPPSSMGAPQPPFSSAGGPPPPSSSAGPPSSMGASQPPNSMGGMAPRPNIGMPPQSGGAGMPPRPAMGMPPQSGAGGMPPQPGMGMPPQPGMGGQPGYGGAGGYGGSMGGMNQPQRKALDPDSMPNPIQVMADDKAAHNTGEFITNEKGKVPPLVTTPFLTRDQGNSGPRLMRATMYSVPDSPDMKKQTSVPLGLVMSPLAEPKPGEYPVPVVNLGELGPVRCIRCKAYISPFMVFTDGGKRFACAYCKATTEVPQEYFQHLDHTGQRIDKNERPELCLGTYEFLATKDYCRDSKPPKPPGILFAIDVSYPMMKEGIVQLISQNIKDVLRGLPVDTAAGQTKSNMKVGFMTYDKSIHFYNLSPRLAQPQQLAVGDVDDMFVPMAEGLMVDVAEAEANIDSLMEQLPSLFSETRETETILAPVVQAGKEAFRAAGCCGKLIIFHHNLPVAEAPGKLKNRDDRKCLGTDREKTVLTPQTKLYNDLGQECVGVGCSVDLFLFNNAYIDIATLSQVCRLTGGQVYKYTYFQTELDAHRFIQDLKHNISRPVAFDAIMRVRTSTGVRPTDFYGAYFMANTTDFYGAYF